MAPLAPKLEKEEAGGGMQGLSRARAEASFGAPLMTAWEYTPLKYNIYISFSKQGRFQRCAASDLSGPLISTGYES